MKTSKGRLEHLETNNEYLFDDTLSENDLDLMRKLDDIYANSDKLAIKKLSKNDRAWAWPKPTNIGLTQTDKL